jgi:hypothetical protein
MAFAFDSWTHEQIVIDAVHYMADHPDTTQYNKLKAAALAAGYTMDSFTQALANGAAAPDDFDDTYICGAITGDCEESPVWGAGSSIIKYTAFWHFANYPAGPDVHGNPIGGYDYDRMVAADTVDVMIKTWLVDDSLDDGPGGMTGWCFWGHCSENSKYNTYGITEAHYRQGTYSKKSMYQDFQSMPFQPIFNLSEYWFQQFLAQPTVQTLGFSLHATDLLQPLHVWVTSGHSHAGLETWFNDNYEKYDLNDPALVAAAFADYTPISPNATDIRPIETQAGYIAYSQGGILLTSTSDADRISVGKIVIPHAIAMVVDILNRAALRF